MNTVRVSAAAASRPSVSARMTVLTAVTPMVWGTTYLVTSEFLPPGRPFLAATARALPVGVIFVARTRRLPRGVWWWRAGVLGGLNIGAFFALLFVAAFRLPGGIAATAGAIQPLVAAAIAVGLLGERFTRRTLIGGLLGTAGVAMLVLRAGAHLDPVGIVAALAGTVSMATGVVLTKRWGRPIDLVTFTGWQLSAGGLMLIPVTLAAEGLPAHVSVSNTAGLLWLAVIGTGLAYTNWFHGIQHLPIATISVLVLLSPLVATTLGWLVLDQRLGPVQIAGAVLVAVAVVTPHLGRRAIAPGPTRTGEQPE